MIVYQKLDTKEGENEVFKPMRTREKKQGI